MGHQTRESDEVERRKCLRQPLVVTGEAAEAARPGEGALHHPAPGQEHGAALGRRKPHDLQRNSALGGRGRRVRSGVRLVDVGQLDRLARGLLDRRRQGRDLIAVLGVRRGDAQRQQVAEGVHGEVDLAALALLVPVGPAAAAALRGALHRAAVEDDGGRVVGAAVEPAQHRPQVVDHVGEAPGFHPPPRLLVDRLPRREIRRQEAPRRPGPHHPAQGVEPLARVVDPLGRVGAHQRPVGGDERPLVIAHVRGIRFARVGCHPHSVPSS